MKSAWRPPNMDMYSGCYIQNMDIYIYIPDVISRIWIYIYILWILVIWVPMLQMDRSNVVTALQTRWPYKRFSFLINNHKHMFFVIICHLRGFGSMQNTPTL